MVNHPTNNNRSSSNNNNYNGQPSHQQQPQQQQQQQQYNQNGGKNKGKQNEGKNNYNQQQQPQVFNISHDSNQVVWHHEPDTLHFQDLRQPSGTPAQPTQQQIGTLYNVGAVIDVNEKTPQTYK
eukprot:747897-Amphidinium_carterae.1